MGSTLAARRAGIKHAVRPTTRTTITTAANVKGSVVETPQI
jgi:hypothetical protein